MVEQPSQTVMQLFTNIFSKPKKDKVLVMEIMNVATKIDEQYMFFDKSAGGYHIIYRAGERYFRTIINNKFGDMAIVQMSEDEALLILATTSF